jgi:hypothetical protein
MEYPFKRQILFVSTSRLALKPFFNSYVPSAGPSHIFNAGTDLILDILSLIVALVVAVLCWQGHRREKKILLAIFFLLSLWHPGYCIYWFTRLSFTDDTKKTLLSAIFTLSAIVSLILRVGQFVYDVILVRNMGKGLITILRRHERGRLTRATIAGNDVDNLGYARLFILCF